VFDQVARQGKNAITHIFVILNFESRGKFQPQTILERLTAIEEGSSSTSTKSHEKLAARCRIASAVRSPKSRKMPQDLCQVGYQSKGWFDVIFWQGFITVITYL